MASSSDQLPASSPGGRSVPLATLDSKTEHKLFVARNLINGNVYTLNRLHSSLYCFRGHNKVRRAFFDFIDGAGFNRAIAVFITLNVVCTILDTPVWRDLSGVTTFLYVCDIGFQVVFTLEMLCKIIALGLVLHRHSFFRSPQNTVDALLVLVGFAQFSQTSVLVTRLLRLTRSLRAFGYLTRFPLLRSIFIALRQAAAPLRDVMLLMFFIILSMAVLGLQLFGGTLHNRCYLNTPFFDTNGSVVVNATRWVIDPSYPSMPCSTTPSFGFQCPTPGSVCDRHDDVYFFPYRNFDYIWTAIYAVFKFVTLDNWPSDIQNIQAANGSAYFIFAIIIVLFGTYFTLNLVLAVLSGVFEEVTDEEERLHAQAEQLRAEMITASPSAGDFMVDMVTSFKMTEVQVMIALDAYFQVPAAAERAEIQGLDTAVQPASTPVTDDHGCVWWVRRVVWRYAVRQAWFMRLALFVTVINLIVLATDHYGISDTWNNVNNWINFVCTIWFLFEAAIKIVAMGPYYFRDFFNDFDFAICVVSAVELGFSGGGSGGGSVATVLRGFRLARVVRVVNRSKRVRQLMLTVARAGYESSLLFVFLIMYAIVGAVFSVLVFPDAVPSTTRPNFTNFLNSLLAIFLIISGENWNDDVATVMEGYNTAVIALFIPFYILATYIVINFVVVILIKSFNSAADQVNEEEDSLDILDDAAREIISLAKSAEWNPLQGLDTAADSPLQESGDPTRNGSSADLVLRDADANDTDVDSLEEFGFAAVVPSQFNPELNKDFALAKTIKHRAPAGAVMSSGDTTDFSSHTNSPDQKGVTTVSTNATANRKRVVEFAKVSSSGELKAEDSNAGLKPSNSGAEFRKGGALGVLSFKLRELINFNFVAAVADFFGMPKDPHEAFARVHGRSLAIFSIENPVRRFCVLLCCHPLFELVGMLIVVLGCIALGLDNDQARSTTSIDQFFVVTSYITVAFFSLELLLKLVAFGGVVGHYAYFRSIQNCIDFIALLLAYLGLFFSLDAAQSLRVFRLASRWKALRVIVTSLIAAIPGIANIFCLVVFVYFVVGCLGVQIFKGSFFSCSDAAVMTRDACVGLQVTNNTAYNYANGTFYPYQASSNATRYWNSAFFNFDHLGQAYLSMVFLQFSDGWSQLLFYAMDSNSDTQAMSENNTWWWAILISYLFMQNNYFLNNLFVGSLMDSFSAEREKATGKIDATGRPLLSEAQERWIREYRFIEASKLPVVIPSPVNPVRRFLAWIYFADDSKTEARALFDWTITACILINVAFMMSQYDGQPDYWTQALYWINLSFAAVFGVEFIIKVIAMTPQGYFSDHWNKFDFLMLVGAIVSIFFNGPGTNAVRILRVARVLRLIRRAKGLYRLFESLVYALPQLFNVVVINLLVLFVFGVIGVSLFQNIYWDNTGTGTLGPYFNFDNLPNAVMLLFQISTTESWGSVLQACLVTEDNSNCMQAAGNCGSNLAYPYFLAFMVMANSVCVNLLILIVVDNFEEVSQMKSKMSQFLLYRMTIFRQRWAQLDVEHTGSLPWATFISLLRQMHYSYEGDYETFVATEWLEGTDGVNITDESVLDDVPSDGEGDDASAGAELRPSSADLKDPVAMRLLGNALGLAGFEGKQELEQSIRNRFHIPLNVLNDAFFVSKVTAMSIPVSVNGTVLYKDCVLGIIKEFHHAEEETNSVEGANFLRSIIDYDRLGVFKLHHALASIKIQRAFVGLLRRKGRGAAADSPVRPDTPPPPPATSLDAPDAHGDSGGVETPMQMLDTP